MARGCLGFGLGVFLPRVEGWRGGCGFANTGGCEPLWLVFEHPTSTLGLLAGRSEDGGTGETGYNAGRLGV